MISSKKEVKRMILAHFRTLDPKTDYRLPRGWVEDYCMRCMRPNDRPVVQAAVQDLVAIGILAESHRGLGRLELTDLGAQLILQD